MQFHFATVLVLAIVAAVFLFAMLLLASLLAPRRPDPIKLSPYECGEPPVGGAWLNFNIRFYIVALIFLVFEVEIVFLLPVAVVFRDLALAGEGAVAFVEMLLFLAILGVGLAFVWWKGDFDWLKRVVQEERVAPATGD